jgi:chemotaxis protein MotB
MSHKRKESEGESEGNSERWLLSYSDFMTLLMVIFVVLYSMGQTDVAKYKQLAESLQTAFSFGSTAKIVDPKINQTNGGLENGKAQPIVVPDIPSAAPKSEEVASELTKMLSTSNLGNEVSVQTNVEGVLISLSEKLIFKPGTAELPSDVYPVLDIIIDMLKSNDNSIRLVGHTDDRPPQDSKYPDNMALSVARAMVVADYMISKGINPERLTVSGCGQYQPVFPNDTDEHRALNGRVDIVVVYKVAQNSVGISNVNVAP